MRPGRSWTDVSSPGLMTSNMPASTRCELGEPLPVLADRELLIVDVGMPVAAVGDRGVDRVPFFPIDRHEADPVAGAEQRQAVLERGEPLLAIPDRHRRAGEDLVAAGRPVGIDAGDGAAVADGAPRRPG